MPSEDISSTTVETKKKVKPYYSELQGYLSQAPPIKDVHEVMPVHSQWEQMNNTIDLLSSITQTDYSRFKIKPERGYSEKQLVRVAYFRSQLGGLISNLHAAYFFDEPAPFSGMPSTIINQTQNQEQNFSLRIALELQKKIDEKLYTTPNQEEKTYLEKISAMLPTIKNSVDLISMILNIASQVGLDVNALYKIFS